MNRRTFIGTAAAEQLKIELQVFEVRSSSELDQKLEADVKGESRALVQLSSPLFERCQKQIADFALRHRLPAISISSRFTDAGGLMAYGPVRPEFGRQLGIYIDKIIKGAKPGDLPIEQASKFELTVNRKTAKALRITLPQALLGRADRVIE